MQLDLIVFFPLSLDPTDVVQVTINDHTDPDPNENCNSFNTTSFQVKMTVVEMILFGEAGEWVGLMDSLPWLITPANNNYHCAL